MTSIRPVKASSAHEREREKMVRIPERWVWHYGMLHSLRERLLQEQENEMAAAAQPVEGHSMSLADSATDEFDHEMALCLLGRERNALREVDAAIQRILTGTYGICEESGKPIPAARLHVVPWARFTREAHDKREREGLDQPLTIPPLASIQGFGAAVLAGAENPETEELQTREMDRHQREARLRDSGQGIEREPEPPTESLAKELSSPRAIQKKRKEKGSVLSPASSPGQVMRTMSSSHERGVRAGDAVLQLNQDAFAMLRCKKDLRVVPGATHLFGEPGKLEEVAQLAAEWFRCHLGNETKEGPSG